MKKPVTATPGVTANGTHVRTSQHDVTKHLTTGFDYTVPYTLMFPGDQVKFARNGFIYVGITHEQMPAFIGLLTGALESDKGGSVQFTRDGGLQPFDRTMLPE